MPLSSIFISYRVADALAEARALHAELSHHMGRDVVFLDKKRLQAGMDWPDEIASALHHCRILLIVVKDVHLWRGEQANSTARIDDPKDWVRREVETAIQGRKVVIPVLFDGAKWPPEQGLPSSLQPILTKQGKKMTTEDLESDATALAVHLKTLLPEQGKVQIPDWLLWAGLFLVTFLIIIAVWKGNPEANTSNAVYPSVDSSAQKIVQTPPPPLQKPVSTTTSDSHSRKSASLPSPSGPKHPAVPALPFLEVKVSDASYHYFFDPAISNLMRDMGIQHRTTGPKRGSRIVCEISLLQHRRESDLTEQLLYSLRLDLSMRDQADSTCFSKRYFNKQPRLSRVSDTESQFDRLILTPCIEEIGVEIRKDNPQPCRG